MMSPSILWSVAKKMENPYSGSDEYDDAQRVHGEMCMRRQVEAQRLDMNV